VNERDETQQVFGVDVEGWTRGTTRKLGEDANAIRCCASPRSPGEYTVQALLHVYETFHRATGTW